ncbi:methyltransferase domain protein [Ceratobasidium sp. AG-Ba]|nr:methyltransferase domain protein [Ceratobasidium sp. AG-Ba]QRW11682.1 methyltransferase domain protein [Ceratobasidium sp. AG-Ba]
MARPYYDDETEGMVYHVTPGLDDGDIYPGSYVDSDMETISSASTTQTASTITSDEIGGKHFFYTLAQMQHAALKALLHGNYVGPVKYVLRPRSDGKRPRILDIRTCCGTWAQEMATEFPHCDITSVDIVPITAHIPKPNIAFEVYDLYAGVAEEDESFDYISCRHVQLAVKEYDRLLFDLHRVLKPGGLICIAEVENCIFEVDNPPYTTMPVEKFPSVCRGITFMHNAIRNQGIDIDAIFSIGQWMRPGSEWWRRVGEKYQIPAHRVAKASIGIYPMNSQVVLMPTGRWHPDPAVAQVGSLISRLWQLAWKQLAGVMAENGMEEEEARNVSRACTEEFARGDEMRIPSLAKYWMWWGFKPKRDVSR